MWSLYFIFGNFIRFVYYNLASVPDSLSLKKRGFILHRKKFESSVSCENGLCLRNRTTLRFNILHTFMVSAQTSAFQAVLINKNVIFLLHSSLHFCLSFGFVFIRMRSWESWNFRILCIKKTEVCAQITLRLPMSLRKQQNRSKCLTNDKCLTFSWVNFG